MEGIKFKYSTPFRDIIRGMRNSSIAEELWDMEDKSSNNLIDITDKKKLLKCIINDTVREVKCGKIIKNILPDSKSSDVEDFVNKYRSMIFESNFKIVEGEDIKKYYKKESYYDKPENGSSLYESCMNDKPSEYFDIYTKNGVRLIILIDDKSGKILGRALLWDNINNEDISMMDIPYIAFQSLIHKFKDFAEDNNFFYVDDLSDEIYKEGMFVTLKENNFKHYPYSDTFKTFDVDDDKVLWSGDVSCIYERLEDGKKYKCIEKTNGNLTLDEGQLYFDGINDDIPKYTFNYTKLRECEFDGRYYPSEDTVDWVDNSIFGFSEKIHKDNLQLINNANYHISNMLDFSDKRSLRLFLYKFWEIFGKYDNRIFRHTMNTEDFELLHIYHRIIGKRKRKMLIPIQFDHPTKEPFEAYIEVKIMPSGLLFTLFEKKEVIENKKYLIFGNEVVREVTREVVGQPIRQIGEMTLDDFHNYGFDILKSDIDNFVH